MVKKCTRLLTALLTLPQAEKSVSELSNCFLWPLCQGMESMAFYLYFTWTIFFSHFFTQNKAMFPLIHSGIPTHHWKEVSNVSRTSVLFGKMPLGVLTRTTGFMRHLPIMLTRTHSSAPWWPAPGPEGWLEVMAISLPHGVLLSGMLPPAGCSAARSPNTRECGNSLHFMKKLAASALICNPDTSPT